MGKVFKYRANIVYNDRDRDSLLLSKSTLYAARLDKMNDPFEGSVELPHSDDDEHWVTPLIQDLGRIGVYSLSKPRDNEKFPCNELLWAHYANSHKGFCIEYDLDKLINSKNASFDVRNQINVEYKNDRPEVFESDTLFDVQQKVFGTKSLAWEYENEIRLVFNTDGKKSFSKEAVSSIYFGLNISYEDRQEILHLMSNRNIDFYQIERIDNNYLLKATKLLATPSYEVVNKKSEYRVDNYIILYKSSNKDKHSIRDFVKQFRKKLSRPSNLTIIDDIRAKDILLNYRPRQLMPTEDIEIQTKHWIAYSSFDAPELIWMYPER